MLTSIFVLCTEICEENLNEVFSFKVWDFTLAELSRQIDNPTTEEIPAMFHERLYSALDLMVEFFHADGQALSMEILNSPNYYQIEQRLQYHRTDTETLIEMFYMQRLQEQITITSSPYGNLAVRTYFNHDSLCVEVSFLIHLKALIGASSYIF